MTTLVSAIIPTHDRPDRLKRAIGSVEAQTHIPIELIVVGSPKTPEVTDVVHRANVHSSQYVDAGAESPGAARNVGIDRASGEWIAFLDDDDEWLPEKIEQQLSRLRRTNSEVCHTGIRKVGPDGQVRAVSHPTTEGHVTEELLAKGPYGSVSAMMVQRDIAEQVGGFDEELVLFEDNDFNVRVSREAEFCAISEDLVIKHADEREQVSDMVSRMASDGDRFIEKHEQLAMEYGPETARQMIVRVKHGIGRAAANQGMYSKAREYFSDALREDPTHYPSMLWLLLVAGGPVSFRTAQTSKRWAVRLVNGIKS